MSIAVTLMIILVSSGVYMGLQLLSLIKSLAEKIDELMKEVKNISRSRGGTEDTKQPEGDSDDTKQLGGDSDNTKQPGGGTGDTKQPGGGTDDKNVRPPPPHSKYPTSIEDSKKTIKDISEPVNIYITDDGKVFITAWGDGHVHIFDKDGNFQKKVRTPAGGIIGICGKGDRIYVASFLGGKVYEFTTDGELIGDKISIPYPVGVGVDSDGKFYISQDAGSKDDTGKIHVYNPDGSKSCEMSGIGSYPRKIQFDSDDNIRVSDWFTDASVLIVTKSGTVLTKFRIGVKMAEGLFVDSDDNMYVCDRNSPGEVYICDKDGREINVIKGFKGAGDVFIAPDGTLWITDYTGNKVYLF